MDETRPTVAEIRPVVRRSYVFLRRTLNEGVGLILLSIVLLSLVAIFGRISWTKYRRYNSEVAKQIRDMMAPNEPGRDDPRLGLIAAVLAPLNGDPDELGQLSEFVAAKHTAAEVHKSFDRWIEELRDRRLGFAPEQEQTPRAKEILRSLTRGSLSDEETVENEDELVRLLEETLDLLIHPQKPATTSELGLKPVLDFSSVGTREQTLGVAWTDADIRFGQSDLAVPSITAQTATEPFIPVPTGATGEANQLLLSPRVTEAVHLSRLFDLALRGSFPKEQEGRYKLFQSYLISVDSVLRLFTGRRGQVEGFPPSRLWASAHYLETLLQGVDDEYLSPAYIDFAGRGVVVTYTTPVLGEKVLLPAGGRAQRFLGIIGTDIGIPDKNVLGALGRHPWLFNIERIDFRIRKDLSGADLQLRTPPPPDQADVFEVGVNDTSTRWEDSSNDRKREVAGWVNAVLGGARVTADELERRVTPLNDGSSFLVPLGSPERGRFHGVILTPKAPDTPWKWLVATVGLLGAFFALTLHGAVLTRRAARLSDQASILRGLQVGVVLVDEYDWILGANDVAEQLLGAILPKYGAAIVPGENRSVPTFVDLIETWITTTKQGEPGKLVRVKYTDTIPELRSKGQHSTYYARVVRNGKIVKISASPMLSAVRRRRLIGSFGVLEEVLEGPNAGEIRRRLEHPRQEQGKNDN